MLAGGKAPDDKQRSHSQVPRTKDQDTQGCRRTPVLETPTGRLSEQLRLRENTLALNGPRMKC